MDDRQFDSLVKALATGVSRRILIKGLLGLGGAAAIGHSLRDEGVDAARRPAPTPTPLRCPGIQIASGNQCVCPNGNPTCGPDCCNPAGIGSAHSECCDQACCFGHCYGEELCCDFPLVFCEAQNECCGPGTPQCCGSEGCCDHACCPAPGGSALCCEGDTPYCCGDGCCSKPCCEGPNGSSVCCDGDGETCCPDGVCILEGGCCGDRDCGEGTCWRCVDHACTENQDACAGCLDCVNGSCVQTDANCDDPENICALQTCNVDGSCTTVVENDCRKTDENGNLLCPCVPSDECNDAACNATTGACEETFNCAKLGLGEDNCCNFGDPCLTRGLCSYLEPDGGRVNPTTIGDCTYDVICSDECCDTFFGTDCGEFGLCIVPD